MRMVEPFGTPSTVSWKPFTGGVTVSGSDSGKISGPSTKSPMIRKIQRRSTFSSESRNMGSVLPAQVGALDAEDHAQPGRHHAERGADQDRALRGVLRDVHDPVL